MLILLKKIHAKFFKAQFMRSHQTVTYLLVFKIGRVPIGYTEKKIVVR